MKCPGRCRWFHRWTPWVGGASYHPPFFRFWERRECRDCEHVQARAIDPSVFDVDQVQAWVDAAVQP